VSAARPQDAHVPEVIWHDVECGAYAADLPLWRDLAISHAGPVLDVGAGTGRVSLHLAGQGHRVVALDRGLELTPAGQELVVLPTYTAMLALRKIVAARGFVRPYWERAA